MFQSPSKPYPGERINKLPCWNVYALKVCFRRTRRQSRSRRLRVNVFHSIANPSLIHYDPAVHKDRHGRLSSLCLALTTRLKRNSLPTKTAPNPTCGHGKERKIEVRLGSPSTKPPLYYQICENLCTKVLKSSLSVRFCFYCHSLRFCVFCVRHSSALGCGSAAPCNLWTKPPPYPYPSA